MSSGPVEQLSPITSTSSAASVTSTAWMSVPSSILPPCGSSETLAWIGSVRPASANPPAGRRAGDLGGLAVDLERVLAQAPLVELQPRALEGVGLDHLGAGLEHRGMDALDHVGAVEDQRLVAFALERAVVGLGQV